MDAHPGCDGVTKFAEKSIRPCSLAPQQLMHISTGQVITFHPYVEKLVMGETITTFVPAFSYFINGRKCVVHHLFKLKATVQRHYVC